MRRDGSYDFFLAHAVDNLREFLVPYSGLLEAASASGFVLASHAFFATAAGFAALPPALQHVAGLYQSFRFMRAPGC